MESIRDSLQFLIWKLVIFIMALADTLESHPNIHVSISPEDQYQSFKRKYGKFYPLPKETESVFINWENDEYYRISVTLPPQRRTISAQWWGNWPDQRYYSPIREIEVDTPRLLISTYAHVRNLKGSDGGYIYQYDDTEKSHIKLKAYCISNVGSDGKICFGGKRIYNLRQMNAMFWGGPFNPDILPPSREDFKFQHGFDCPEIKHSFRRCGKKTPRYLHCHRHVGHPDHVEDCFCLCGPGHDSRRGAPHICGWCDKLRGLTEENKKIVEKEWEAKGKVCACCLEICQCECRCHCCRKSCDCRCSCDLTEEYFEYLANYDNSKYALDWHDMTSSILGGYWNTRKKKFISFPEKASGLFISTDEQFIDHILGSTNAKNHYGTFTAFGIVRELDADHYLIMFSKDKIVKLPKYRLEHSIV